MKNKILIQILQGHNHKHIVSIMKALKLDPTATEISVVYLRAVEKELNRLWKLEEEIDEK